MNEIAQVIELDEELIGKRERTKANNRRAILNAAREVFSELGYGAASVRDIIRRTGLASGTFYNYYRSKEEVFEALLDDVTMSLRPRLTDARRNARTFDDFLFASYRVYFDFCCNDRAAFNLLRVNADEVRIKMNTHEVDASVADVRTDLVAAMKAGLCPRVDPDLLTASLVGIGRDMANYLMTQARPDIDAAAAFATALVISGVEGMARRGKA